MPRAALAFHPGRSVRARLQYLAAAGRLARSRPDEVLALVGLAEVAGKRAKTSVNHRLISCFYLQ